MMATVAEAMIAANCAVAAFTAAAFPQSALLRRHAPPRIEAFAEVRTVLVHLRPANIYLSTCSA